VKASSGLSFFIQRLGLQRNRAGQRLISHLGLRDQVGEESLSAAPYVSRVDGSAIIQERSRHQKKKIFSPAGKEAGVRGPESCSLWGLPRYEME